MKKIMIIEDDPTTRDELALLLESEGFQVLAVMDFTNIVGQFAEFHSRTGLQQTLSEHCNSGMLQTLSEPHSSGVPQTLLKTRSSEVRQTVSTPCDLVLLDLGLPGKNGFTLCMEIRRISRVPILFLTGRDSALDELQALNLGGDDYIVKPCSAPLLLAHINALLRRTSSAQQPDMMEAGGLSVHLTRGTASAGGKCMELTRNELQILVHLMRHPGEIVSRADLINVLWDNYIYIDDNTLSVNMTRLRGKLTELGLPNCIKTRRGLGYQFF